MIYLMSDVHGDYDRFIQLLEQIHFTDQDSLYLLGDVIDKNPQGMKMLDFCMGTPNVFLIKGNHERWMEEYFQNPSFEEIWCKRGGEATLRELKKLSKEKGQEYYQYLKSLPLYLKIQAEKESVLLTHTGYRFFMKEQYKNQRELDIECMICQMIQENEYEYLSYSDIFSLDEKNPFFMHVYVGHVPTFWIRKDKKAEIMHTPNYTNLDCGAGHRNLGGRLGCLCLDTMEEWYL